MLPPLWPTQERAIASVLDRLGRGGRRLLVTSPTGSGKSRTMAEIARHFWESGRTASVLSNRRLMVSQLTEAFRSYGLEPGIRAAGHPRTLDARVQISSIATEWSRVKKTGKWSFFASDVALVDEAHLHDNEQGHWYCNTIIAKGGSVVLFTATPIDLAGLADELIVAGTPSELRACGALVPAIHFGPDEPDLRRFEKAADRLASGENVGEETLRPLFAEAKLFGRVWKHYQVINPEGRPTILFAPGVAESLWFAEQFEAAGVPAAHIDGEDVWIRGKWRRDKEARNELREASRTGAVKVTANRFVLREGVDWPWLSHGILATVFGSLATYLQAGGRLLRAYPGKPHATIQDHGGHWWRHGSLNADRDWHLDWSGRMYVGVRAEQIRAKLCGDCHKRIPPGQVWCPLCGGLPADPEPIRCPRCGAIYGGWAIKVGLTCSFPGCGFTFQRGFLRSRPVVTEDGELREMTGDAYSPRKEQMRHDTLKTWVKVYYRCKRADKTFNQADALFAIENWYHPPRNLPLMPRGLADWFRKIKDVPETDLTAGYGATVDRKEDVV